MAEISINEYVRTDNGIIGKYAKYMGIHDSIETNSKWIGFDMEKDIVKHSKNIIDLIKIGDFVNGEYVHNVDYEKQIVRINHFDKEGKYAVNRDLKKNKIYSIVTKESFKNAEYRVETD